MIVNSTIAYGAHDLLISFLCRKPVALACELVCAPTTRLLPRIAATVGPM